MSQILGYQVLVEDLRAHSPWKSELCWKHYFAVMEAVLQIANNISIPGEKGNDAQGPDSIYKHIGSQRDAAFPQAVGFSIGEGLENR